jgi:hypothetical protein
MANKANGEKKRKARGPCLVHKTDMDRATDYAHKLGFKVTGFNFLRDGFGVSVEDHTEATGAITPRSGDDDLDRAIDDDDGD